MSAGTESPLTAPPPPPEEAPRRGWGLATKLILSITVLVILVVGAGVPLSLRALEQQRERETVLGADQLSRTIVSATWDAMLRDHREEAYRAMKMIAQQPGIERIRIFNKEGRIMFSSWAETGAMVDKRAEACDLCHTSGQPLVHVDLPTRARTFGRPSGKGRVLGLVTPIYNDPACSTAACHAHPGSTRVLGVLDVHLSLDRVDDEIAAARARGRWIMVALIGLSSLAIVLSVRRFVDRPIKKLIAGTRAVSNMQLDRPLEVPYDDELGELAHAFDVMRGRLKSALAERDEFARDLERKVEERTEQLKAAQDILVRRDRLASLGQLAASVAHEINNPLSGVLNYTMLMERILRPDGVPPGRVEEFRGYLGQVAQETSRVGRIVTSLLSFARPSKARRVPQDMTELIQATVALVQHKLDQQRVYARIEIEPGLPLCPCDGSQLRQVVMNLVMNAAEAMPDGGSIAVRARRQAAGDTIVLEVEDKGMGMTDEQLAHVFDPFFTTKGEGGCGLGLTVVYGIVTAHGGSIDIRSRVGEGTLIRVHLPLNPPPDEALPDALGTGTSNRRTDDAVAPHPGR